MIGPVLRKNMGPPDRPERFDRPCSVGKQGGMRREMRTLDVRGLSAPLARSKSNQRPLAWQASGKASRRPNAREAASAPREATGFAVQACRFAVAGIGA